MADEVPEGVKERIKELTAARDAAKAEAAEARLAAKAAADELAPLREASKAWASERAFLAAGLSDPDAQLVARTFHERIPEAERPTLDAWLTSVKADPTKGPKALAPYLGVNETKTAAVAGQAPAGVRAAGVLPRSQETHASAGVPVTKEALSAAYKAAVRSKDFTQYDAMQAAVLAEHDR